MTTAFNVDVSSIIEDFADLKTKILRESVLDTIKT
jgi:hypothetical protein